MKVLCLIFSLLFAACSFGQLGTSTAQTPTGLVQNVLLGQGVTVSNIQYSGTSTSIGSFTAAGTNLGIASGIVMTTGTVVNNGNGPHGPNNSASSGIDNGSGGSTQLSNLIGGIATHNAAILQFDFVPYSDTVRFKYVFGSEEYPEYVGSTFNDVFAFFISGPGIAGGQQNIAKLPNGSPVTINNVNAGANSAYYVNNGDGSQSPYNSSSNYIQYDGFTKVMEAVSQVQCGETYHLIIAIADAGDGIVDSGIFLEANSLNSKIPVETSYSLSALSSSQPNIMAEGCTTATITLTRNGNISNSLTIPVNVSGTATEGVDYTNLPNSVTFPAGQSQISFTFDALTDVLTEGIETINLEFPITDPCGNVSPIFVNLGIDDIQPVMVTVQSSDVLCPGDPLEMIANVTGGGGPYVYQWSTSETTSSIFVSPTSTATYTVSVTDNCLHETAVASGTVTVPVYTPLVLNETPDITTICPYVDTILEANASGGAGGYTYVWTATEPADLGTGPVQEVVPSTTTGYTVEVTDQCGESAIAYIVYTITSPPLLLTMSPDTEVCPGDSTLISVSATGGYGQYYYVWKVNADTTTSIWVTPKTSPTVYEVSVQDDCHTFTVEGFVTITIIAPVADFEINSSSALMFQNLPISFHNLTSDGVNYIWNFGDGNTSSLVNPNNTYAVPGSYDITLIAIDAKGCMDSITKPITIEDEYYIYVPNAFTPDGKRFNATFKASTVGVQQLSISIFNRWGELVFKSDDVHFQWDGTYNSHQAKEGIYTYKINCLTNSNRQLNFIGHISLLR